MSTPEHYIKSELHPYFFSVSPKTLLETLAVAEFALVAIPHTSRTPHDVSVISEMIQECKRQRPTGSDGKHGNLHTPECGCEF